MNEYQGKIHWSMESYNFDNSSKSISNTRENKLELLEYVIQRYDISDADLEDNERFQSILRELKIEELINE